MVSWLTNLFGGGTATDPVCGMSVSKKSPGGGTAEHEGTTYYFCGPGCRAEFLEDPKGYLSGAKKMEM
jgi:YHS domain-containing protein